MKLKKKIARDIENGTLVPGRALPSERELAASLGLSRMTVRAAVSGLVDAGLLYREHGRGTFVSARKMRQRNIASFSETVARMGFRPDTKVLEFSEMEPEKELSEKLLSGDARIYRALRLRLADDIPVALEEVFIPSNICPGLKAKDLNASLYNLINTYGHEIGSADCSVLALHPSPRQQQYLDITRNTPVLKIDSLYYSASGLALYYERAVYRADMYEYNIRITT